MRVKLNRKKTTFGVSEIQRKIKQLVFFIIVNSLKKTNL